MLFSSNGKICFGAACVLLYSWQKQTVIEIPTCVLSLQGRLEIGSEQTLGAAFKFCSLFLPWVAQYVYDELGSPLF